MCSGPIPAAPAHEKCHGLQMVDSGIEIAVKSGVTDMRGILYVVLGHLRERDPDIADTIRKMIAAGGQRP